MGFASAARTIDFVRSQLHERNSTVQNTKMRDCVNDIKLFLELVDSEFLLRDIVGSLPVEEVDLDEWKTNLREKGHDLPPNLAERATKCLAILRYLSQQTWHQVVSIAIEFSSAKGTYAVPELLDPLVSNLATYLDEELHRLQVVATPEEILHDVARLIGEGEQMEPFPGTRAALGNASRTLAEATTANDYQNVGNTCRQALIEFGQELYREEYRPSGVQSDPKGDDAVQRLSWSARYLLPEVRGSGRGRFVQGTEEFVKCTWQLVNALLHDTNASLDDARLSLMCTYMIVWRLSRAFAIASGGQQSENADR